MEDNNSNNNNTEVINFDPKMNHAVIFAGVVKKLRSIASENEIADSIAIEAFIQDLQNLNKEGYEKNIKTITVKEMPNYIRKALIEYLQKVLKEQKRAEKKAAKKPEQESRKQEREAVREAKRKKEAEENAKRQAEEREERRKRKVQLVLAEIYSIVEKESKKKGVRKQDILIKIRKDKFGSKKTLSKEEEIVKSYLDDEIFYEEVRYYTRDFEFLTDEKFIADASLGHTGRKFRDFASFERYNKLKSDILNGTNEENGIIRLSSQDLDNATKRILEQRMIVINKRKARRESTGMPQR